MLNKSDQIEQQQLMRVYGALMWSLGKVFRSPEVGAGRVQVQGGVRCRGLGQERRYCFYPREQMEEESANGKVL